MSIDYSDPSNRSHASPDVAFRTPPSDLYITHNIDRIMKRLNLMADKKTIYSAINKAAVRTRNWLQTQLARELAARTDIQKKKLRTRFKRGKKQAVSAWSNLAVLWIGVNPIPVHLLKKKPIWDRSRGGGVRVGSRYFAGAFLAKIYSKETKVWRRMGKKRFPVILMTVPIQQEMEAIIKKYEKQTSQKFEERIEHELKFALGWFN